MEGYVVERTLRDLTFMTIIACLTGVALAADTDKEVCSAWRLIPGAGPFYCYQDNDPISAYRIPDTFGRGAEAAAAAKEEDLRRERLRQEEEFLHDGSMSSVRKSPMDLPVYRHHLDSPYAAVYEAHGEGLRERRNNLQDASRNSYDSESWKSRGLLDPTLLMMGIGRK